MIRIGIWRSWSNWGNMSPSTFCSSIESSSLYSCDQLSLNLYRPILAEKRCTYAPKVCRIRKLRPFTSYRQAIHQLSTRSCNCIINIICSTSDAALDLHTLPLNTTSDNCKVLHVYRSFFWSNALFVAAASAVSLSLCLKSLLLRISVVEYPFIFRSRFLVVGYHRRPNFVDSRDGWLCDYSNLFLIGFLRCGRSLCVEIPRWYSDVTSPYIM